MKLFLGLLIIHAIEIFAFLFFLLIRKNRILEKANNEKQQVIDSMSIILNRMNDSISALDTRVGVGEDEDIKGIIDELKEAGDLLNNLY